MGFLLPRASCPLGPRAALYGPWGHDALGGENPFCFGIRCENTPFLMAENRNLLSYGIRERERVLILTVYVLGVRITLLI